MDTILGYSPMDEAFETRMARLELALIVGGALGFGVVMGLRNAGRTQDANLLTGVGLIAGSLVAAIRVVNQHTRTITRIREQARLGG